MSSQIVLQAARTIAFGDVLRELSEDELRALYRRYIEPGGRMAKLVASNLMGWANLRWQYRAHQAGVPGVWLDATRADPVALLLWEAKRYGKGKGRKRRWTLKSVSGWKPFSTAKIAGTREMKLLKAA